MKSRWVVVSALIVSLALSSVVASAPTTIPGDPYLGASLLTTEAAVERASCQIFASDCVYDGGPCGPRNQCSCQFRPSGPIAWICAR